MAERRMFSKTIIDSDAFLDMPLSSQALYFHLSMRADDEGFVNNPKKIQRMIGASDDDMKVLLAKNFIILFESGVIVIKHWKIHNYIRGDRINETNYQDEKALLQLKENGSYTLCQSNVSQMSDTCQANVSIGKVSIDKDSIDNNINIVRKLTEEKVKKDSYMDQVEEILSYLNEKTGKKFTSRSKSSVKMIKDRLREGYVVDEFKAVIDNKVAAWGNNPDMKIYLRPETLFRPSHFDSYLNDVEDEKQKRKREAAEIDERQREAIRQSNDFGFE
ncbi:MAG: conserved phage C-terminal domain-containing protein [Lachnospiraceae bacterium]|nr:conserved phage C-terminal domain-containing protein [Lachnospiraceae bacterium]